MTPPPSHHPCEGCALQEARGGRVCPAVCEVYGLADLVAQHRAEALHTAILADAGRVPGLAELIRRDAMSRTGALPTAVRLGLLAAPTPDPMSTDARKEYVRVLPPRTA